MTSGSLHARQVGQHQNAATDIPSSTVVAIGGGFICFALFVLSSLTGLRVLKLHREVRRRRRSGETGITVRELWNRQGGFWGFFTGSHNVNPDSILIGAGGRGMTQYALMQELRLLELMREAREAKANLIVPTMWEVEVPEKGRQVQRDEMRLGDVEPLGVVSSPRPVSESDDIDPSLNLSVLILLPTSPPHQQKKMDDEYDDLPDMVVGTTMLLPYLDSTDNPTQSSETLKRSVSMSPYNSEEKGDGTEVAVVQLDHHGGSTTSNKRARWLKDGDGKWTVEGLS